MEKVMNKNRQGEIALALFKHRLAREGLPRPDVFAREIGNIAAETKIPKEDLVAFFEAQLPEYIGKLIGRSDVTLTTSGAIKWKDL
jgi:hypothetical protein